MGTASPELTRKSDFAADLHGVARTAEGQHGVVKRAKTEGEEVQRLRDDNEVLRRDVEVLRAEFRALKHALLVGS